MFEVKGVPCHWDAVTQKSRKYCGQLTSPLQKKGTTIIADYSLKRRSSEQFEVRECLLSFGAECFVFQFDIQNITD
jgi:hypothetical protein